MTRDLELEAWQHGWRTQTEPLPELKKKIARQNARMWAGIVAVGVCLVISTVQAWRTRTSLMEGLASGLWVSSVTMGAYDWWARRGSWKPTAQTSLAYAELCYKRAVAKRRIIRFAFHFLLLVTVLYASFVGWHHKALTGTEASILAALVVELGLFRYQQRRQLREIDKTRTLVRELRDSAEPNSTER